MINQNHHLCCGDTGWHCGIVRCDHCSLSWSGAHLPSAQWQKVGAHPAQMISWCLVRTKSCHGIGWKGLSHGGHARIQLCHCIMTWWWWHVGSRLKNNYYLDGIGNFLALSKDAEVIVVGVPYYSTKNGTQWIGPCNHFKYSTTKWVGTVGEWVVGTDYRWTV